MERQWRPRRHGPIRPGLGTTELGELRRGCEVRLRGPGREEPRWDDEGWLESTLAMALLPLRLGASSRKKKGRGGTDKTHERIRAVRGRRGSPARATRGVASGVPVAGMGVEASTMETQEGTVIDFDQRKLKISYVNLKFGQNKSCRGRKDLQL